MPESSYHYWTERLQTLAAAIGQLEPVAREMNIDSWQQSAWYGALFRHLLPQIQKPPMLLVAVTGGTNTGKSTIFNYLAGSSISRVHPNATKTKHPVCLLPVGSSIQDDLSQIFPDFELRSWQSEDDAVAESDEDLLIVRNDDSENMPANLILLDTPDIDGSLKDNWRRTERIRHSADCIVCVLTQQKYADDAVVQFFREAGNSDKTFIVLINMVQWPEEQEVCRGWLEAFSQSIGVSPDFAYAVGYDKGATLNNSIQVHPLSDNATNLQSDISQLHFESIKLRTFRGSLSTILDRQSGIPSFLHELGSRSNIYADARDVLSRSVEARNISLPQLPVRFVWQPISDWLEPRRTKFDRVVHGLYGKLGRAMTFAFRKNDNQLEEDFRRQESECFRNTLVDLLQRLNDLRKSGNDIVRHAVGEVLGGLQQQQLFDELNSRLAEMPLITDDYCQFVSQQLDQFAEQHPRMVKLISWGLVTTAVIRPAVTIGLFAVLPGAELWAQQAVSQTAQHTLATVGVDAIWAASANVAVEGGSNMTLQKLLAKLFSQYYQQRATQMAELLHQKVTGPIVQRVARLANVVESEAFIQIQQTLESFSHEEMLQTENK